MIADMAKLDTKLQKLELRMKKISTEIQAILGGADIV